MLDIDTVGSQVPSQCPGCAGLGFEPWIEVIGKIKAEFVDLAPHRVRKLDAVVSWGDWSAKLIPWTVSFSMFLIAFGKIYAVADPMITGRLCHG